MRLHPTSLLAGAALFASILALSSAAPQTMLAGSPGVIHHDIAHPRSFVEIKEGQPYTVPSNRLFVVTHVGASDKVYGDGRLSVNGVQVIEDGPTANPISLFVCQPDDVVEVVDSSNADQGRAWGFLTDL